MPFKSKAQMVKMALLVREGKISQKTFDEFAKHTKNIKALPDKVSKKSSSNKIGKIKKIK